MAKIKSFSTNDGDMFYIKHNTDNFTIIDCCIDDENKEKIINELEEEGKEKNIVRLISTHPDDDHIRGLSYLYKKHDIPNFYCVKNDAVKDDETDDFKKYCELRDSKKAFYLYKGCTRKWMNIGDLERGCAGINILWPDEKNEDFKKELENAKNGSKVNNICPIIKYSIEDSIKVYWFGDLETEYMDKIKDKVDWVEADVIFAPHHGRSSGKMPKEILEKINPKVIIIGEAPFEHIDYYEGYETITQNTAKDIVIICDGSMADFYVSNKNYKTTPSTLKKINNKSYKDYLYIGSLEYNG